MADVYGLPDGRLAYSLLYARLRDEAEEPHADSWVTTISLGSVRTLVTAMEMLDALQKVVTDDVILKPDGTVEEVHRFQVVKCAQCRELKLTAEVED